MLSMTKEDDWVFDPFMGVGSTIVAAVRHNRRGMGAEIMSKYVDIACQRITSELKGELRTRPMNRPIYDPEKHNNKLAVQPCNVIPDKPQLSIVQLQNGITHR